MSSLWMRVDVLYFSHPKVIQLHPFAQLLYLRAVAYSKQFLTDGHLSPSAIRSLASDLAIANQTESKTKANLNQTESIAIAIVDPYAVISEWIAHMVAVNLLDQREDGYQIHDFLEWNCSKEHVESISEIRSINGKKGGRPKANGKLIESKIKANEEANEKQNLTHSTEYIVQSTYKEEEKKGQPLASPKREKLQRVLISDEDWVARLKQDPLYAGIDIDLEVRKSSAWYQEHRRKWTRKAFTNWLIRAMGDKPMAAPPKKRILLT